MTSKLALAALTLIFFVAAPAVAAHASDADLGAPSAVAGPMTTGTAVENGIQTEPPEDADVPADQLPVNDGESEGRQQDCLDGSVGTVHAGMLDCGGAAAPTAAAGSVAAPAAATPSAAVSRPRAAAAAPAASAAPARTAPAVPRPAQHTRVAVDTGAPAPAVDGAATATAALTRLGEMLRNGLHLA